MKLSPPASCSDLELSRLLARRLSQLAAKAPAAAADARPPAVSFDRAPTEVPPPPPLRPLAPERAGDAVNRFPAVKAPTVALPPMPPPVMRTEYEPPPAPVMRTAYEPPPAVEPEPPPSVAVEAEPAPPAPVEEQAPHASPEPRAPERAPGRHSSPNLDLKSLLGGLAGHAKKPHVTEPPAAPEPVEAPPAHSTERFTVPVEVQEQAGEPAPEPVEEPEVEIPVAMEPEPAPEPVEASAAEPAVEEPPQYEPPPVDEPAIEEPSIDVPVATDEVPVEVESDVDPLAGLTPSEPEPEPEPEPPPPPTWAEVLHDCLFLARAQAAMLLDGQSTLLTAVGEWPSGRVEALTTRLIPAIEKAQKANPGEPLSVRLGSAVLTAWRVPVAGDQLTVAFLAESPVPYDAFPGVQAALRRHRG